MSIIFRFFIVLVLFLNSYKTVLGECSDHGMTCGLPCSCVPSGWESALSYPCGGNSNYVCCYNVDWSLCGTNTTTTCTSLGGDCTSASACDHYGGLPKAATDCGSNICCVINTNSNTNDCNLNSECGKCDVCSSGSCVDGGTSRGVCSSTTASGVCVGDTFTGTCSKVCNGTKPKVDGGWSNWSTCSNCLQYRYCNNPAPSCDGDDCTGSSTQSCGLSVGASGQCGYPNGVNECFYNKTYPTCNNGNVNIIDDGSSGDNWADWTCSGTAGACGGGNGTTVGCSHHVTYTVNGACLNNGGWFEGLPPNQCANEATPQPVDYVAGAPDFTYDWKCPGICNGTVASCFSNKNTKPVFDKLEIKNTSGDDVTSDTISGNFYNHICQTDFSTTTARFVVTYFDKEGSDFAYRSGDIDWIKLKIGSTEFTNPTYSHSGQYTKATFDIDLSQITSNGVEQIWVNAKGYNLPENGYIVTSNSFKFWDCLVSVSGTIYDGSGVSSLNCYLSPYEGFSKTITSSANFKSLNFTSGSENKSMTISSSTYSSGSNKLTWGKSYSYGFNSDILMEVDLNYMKFRKNGNSCVVLPFNLGNNNVDPYVSAVGITIDFTGIVDQDPWWQVGNGGVVSNFSISNQVPVTCSTCTGSSGLVSSPTIDNTGRSDEYAFPLSYFGSGAKLANTNYSYDYFYNQYFVKNGIGMMANDMGDIGTSGIYFVNGDLNINSNNTVDTGKSLMIIVNGDINVSNAVTEVNGILVADNITATGLLNESALVFNGSLYATDTIDLSRGFKTKRFNNSNPAVKVKYLPQLMFGLPPETSKALTNWKWGN